MAEATNTHDYFSSPACHDGMWKATPSTRPSPFVIRILLVPLAEKILLLQPSISLGLPCGEHQGFCGMTDFEGARIALAWGRGEAGDYLEFEQ